MMTVITRVALDEGAEPAWDAAMRDRMQTAESVEGWVAGQILIPLESPSQRVIVGVWTDRAAWVAWHENPVFRETRDALADLGVDDGETSWHEAVYDARGG